jgi:hypothetical protein
MEFILSISNNPEKKFNIKIGDKNIDFGQKGFKDYIIYNKLLGPEGADKKRKNYIARHSKMGEDWTKKGILSAGFWSRYILWEGRTLLESLDFLKKKFNIKIINKIKKYP